MTTIKSPDIIAIVEGKVEEIKNGIKNVQRVRGSVAVDNTLAQGDIILISSIPGNAVPSKLILFNDDLDSNDTPTLAADIGLYEFDDEAKVFNVVDVDFFATAATTLQAANTAGSDVVNEAGRDIKDIGKSIGEVKSIDEKKIFFIGITISTAAATKVAGDISFDIEYLI